MKFTKPSLSIADQIALLERRGMVIADRRTAEHYLSHISYYRLRAYWYTLEVPAEGDGEHKFAEGTRFEDAVELYVFDRHLKLLVMDAIERIEVSLRGNWAYVLATNYGPHGYLDPAHHADGVKYADNLMRLKTEIERSTDDFIVHYRKKYDQPEEPPIWMVSEVISLGALSKWYANLKLRSDRNKIAKPYGIDEKVMTSIAHQLAYIRNICAHHGRLWNKFLTVGVMLPSSPGSLKLAVAGSGHRRIYATLCILGYLLRIIAPGTSWQQQIVDLILNCPAAEVRQMGFPDDWQARPFWSQYIPKQTGADDVSA